VKLSPTIGQQTHAARLERKLAALPQDWKNAPRLTVHWLADSVARYDQRVAAVKRQFQAGIDARNAKRREVYAANRAAASRMAQAPVQLATARSAKPPLEQPFASLAVTNLSFTQPQTPRSGLRAAA
jgi:hypothetical protein